MLHVVLWLYLKIKLQNNITLWNQGGENQRRVQRHSIKIKICVLGNSAVRVSETKVNVESFGYVCRKKYRDS